MTDANNSEVSLEEQLDTIEYDLQEVEAKLLSLGERKQYLLKRKNEIKDLILLRKSTSLASKDWSNTDFSWSKKVNEVLKNIFKLDGFRPYQLQTINAVLSKEDVILIMPTGGGKSLCYQLPALVNNGITIVISPLISLMEDQLMALKTLNVNAAMLSAQATKEQVNSIQEAMTNKNSSLCLLYVTPEKLAKSKRFMTKLQKTYQMGRLSLIAIDEVHCCSQWGHDFRPDYKFLGVLKSMFPDVPMLGLTATATSRVTVDVQKMLCVQGCLVFKASFNRPNLYYEVRQKPSVQKDCIDQLSKLLKEDYAGKSGIIYTTSIKDCEDLMQELRSRSLRVGCYHANLEPNLRNKVHIKWMSGEYQAVVATIAFGLGIDKPDVRFVIHHALSKSMENFYQESGRAGRDGKPADCILFYRFMDVFKLSTMVFTQQTGLENLYGIAAYCLDSHRCRRAIIASHFDEGWETRHCDRMCDHCRNPRESKQVDITSYCRNLYKIMANSAGLDTKLTAQKLIDSWFGKGPSNLRVPSVPVPAISRETGEAIVATLLIEGYLQEDFHFTPYSTISYIKRGRRAAAALSDDHRIMMTIKGKSVASANEKKSSSEEIVTNSSVCKTQSTDKKASKNTVSSSKTKKESRSVFENRNSNKMNNSSHKSSSSPCVIDLSDSGEDDFVPKVSNSTHKRKSVPVIESDSDNESSNFKKSREEDIL